MRTLNPGARGEAVLDVQARLSALGYRIDPSEHGDYGHSTEQAVREFQQRRQILVDGTINEHTWAELVEAGYSLGDRVLYLRYPYFRGDDVRALQASVNLLGFDAGREDGILGERTDGAIREFQRNVGLRPDGIVGSTTIEAMRRLRPVGPGPGRADVREGEALRRLVASLRGARIGIDAGHGQGDPGRVGPAGLSEAEAAFWLAEALVAELDARGASPFLLRDADANPPEADRARLANQEGPEVVIVLHLNAHEDPAAEGASTYYYGREGWFSQAGQRLAELIQHELTTQLGLKDGRTHPKALTVLRETRMPAVQVEPCFVTNPAEEAAMRDERFRQRLVAAIADAIERYFRLGELSRSPGAEQANEGSASPRPGRTPEGSARLQVGPGATAAGGPEQNDDRPRRVGPPS